MGVLVLLNLMPMNAYADSSTPKTCFGFDSSRTYVEEKYLESVVQLVTVDYSSLEKIKGTGFIVQGSSGKDQNGYNRIMTTRHFIRDSQPFEVNGGMTEVYSSNGQYLGVAILVVTSQNLKLPFNADIKAGEVAVMSMKSVLSDTAYRGIMGLKLGGIDKTPLLSAIPLSSPSGLSFGASGAPVLNLDGYVIGMVTNNIQDIKNEKTIVKTGDLSNMKKTGKYQERNITLPLKSVAIMENYWDIKILKALGEDVLHLTQDSDNSNIAVLPVITQSACVILQGRYFDLATWLEKYNFK
jgi:hypothetical protein